MATTQQKVLASLCMTAGERGKRLFAYSRDQAALESLTRRWKGEAEAIRRIKKLAALSRHSLVSEIHPGWILEKLGGESPRLLNVLRHFLNAEQIQYLRAHLPPQARRLFQEEKGLVDPQVLEVVRPLIEKKLGLTVPLQLGGSFGFPHLGWMKASDLKILFRQLGLREVGHAFCGVDGKMLRTFLSRFPLHLVQEIRSFLHKVGVVAALDRQQSQAHLVSLSLDQIPAERLFEEVGYSVFARALSPAERNYFEIVVLRFRPQEGYRLKRFIDESRVGGEEMAIYKQQILQMVISLAEQGLIQKFWRPHEETTVSEKKVA